MTRKANLVALAVLVASPATAEFNTNFKSFDTHPKDDPKGTSSKATNTFLSRAKAAASRFFWTSEPARREPASADDKASGLDSNPTRPPKPQAPAVSGGVGLLDDADPIFINTDPVPAFVDFDVASVNTAAEPIFVTTTPKPSRRVPCVSDEDCLQRPGSSHTCPEFCVEGYCAPWNKDFPPPLTLKTGIKVRHDRFKLREDEELEKVYSDPPQFFDPELLKGKFLEVVDGGSELLEVRYPDNFFELAKRLEDPSGPGQVPGDDQFASIPGTSRGTEQVQRHHDVPEDLEDVGKPVNPDDVTPTVHTANTLTRANTVSHRLHARVSPNGRRLTAIQDVAPDRWHVGPNQRHPWRMNGRLSMGCTASLIGNRVLLTAAHCVWDRDTNSWDNFPTFAAGQDGDDKPYGDKRVMRMTIPAGYMTCNSLSDCRAHDWAVLVLYENEALNVGYFGFSTVKDGRLNIAGYPQSKNRELWYDNCPLHSDEGKWIKHRCDTEPGNSGSAIYKIKNGNRYVVAVHGGGYEDRWNRGADVAGHTSSAGRLYDRMLASRMMYG